MFLETTNEIWSITADIISKFEKTVVIDQLSLRSQELKLNLFAHMQFFVWLNALLVLVLLFEYTKRFVVSYKKNLLKTYSKHCWIAE